MKQQCNAIEFCLCAFLGLYRLHAEKKRLHAVTKACMHLHKVACTYISNKPACSYISNKPACSYISNKPACSYISLHEVTQAYMHLHRLAWSYISLHAGP